MRTFPDYESASIAQGRACDSKTIVDAALPKTDRERVEYALQLLYSVEVKDNDSINLACDDLRCALRLDPRLALKK